jgi:predicted transcriptional regulator with HTH domain
LPIGIFNPLKPMTDLSKESVCYIIIQHLLDTKDHKDDLDGISLSVFDKEMKNLSDDILTGIEELVSKGLIVECKNSSGEKYYRLSEKQSGISDFLRKKNP